MKLATTREELAAIVASALPSDVVVIDHLPDSISPPCVLFGWSDPWLKPATLCVWTTAIELVALAQRIEPGGQLTRLEEIVSAVLPALNGTAFTVIDVTAPFPMQLGGVDYLAASINIGYELEE